MKYVYDSQGANIGEMKWFVNGSLGNFLMHFHLRNFIQDEKPKNSNLSNKFFPSYNKNNYFIKKSLISRECELT